MNLPCAVATQCSLAAHYKPIEGMKLDSFGDGSGHGVATQFMSEFIKQEE